MTDWESGDTRPDVRLTHRRKKAAGGSRSGSSHKPVAPRGSVCIRGHTGRTRWSRWTGRCSTSPRWPEYRDPCRSMCPMWPLQECQSTENFLNRFWATKEIKACYDAEQRCENYIQEIFTGLCLAYKCTLTAFRIQLSLHTTVQTTTSWIFTVCWLIIKNQYAKKQDFTKIYESHTTVIPQEMAALIYQQNKILGQIPINWENLWSYYIR